MADRKKLTPQQALQRIYKYCAYQERSHHQVREKLYSFGLWKAEVDELITRLITDGFLNEQRFAIAFAGGKFRMKKWGRLKVIRELEAQGVTTNCIKAALKQIDEGDYRSMLRGLAEKKMLAITDANPFVKRDKVARFLISKGYEPDLVWGMLKEMDVGHTSE